MKPRLLLPSALFAIVAFVLGAAAQNRKSVTAPVPAASASTSSANESAEGEKRFQTHCGRCHVPPQDLSPREAKAVVRQMRVRAMLSAEDERLILKYLAP